MFTVEDNGIAPFLPSAPLSDAATPLQMRDPAKPTSMHRRFISISASHIGLAIPGLGTAGGISTFPLGGVLGLFCRILDVVVAFT